MHFSIEQEDATTVFQLKEPKLDSTTASQLKAEFLILAQPDVETLIVDLSAVEYCDSAGLSALLLAQRQMSAHGGDVRLVGLTPSVHALLSVTQLDRVFPIFSTLDDALDAEPSFGDDDDLDDHPFGEERSESADDRPLGPGAPSVNAIKAGAIAAGGSFGAAALAKIMMSPYEENLDELQALTNGEFLLYDDDLEEEEDEFDDDLDEEEIDEEDDEDLDEEDLDEEDDVEEGDIDEDLLEDDDFEDNDFDDEELEEDDVDTF